MYFVLELGWTIDGFLGLFVGNRVRDFSIGMAFTYGICVLVLVTLIQVIREPLTFSLDLCFVSY